MDGVQGFVVMDSVYIQACDPQTGAPLPAGEVGELVVTVFNKAYPLIRFGTGDLGALAVEPDPRTNGRQQLMGLFGRSGEAVKVRGMFLHPNQFRFALARFADTIKGGQAVITRPENRDVVTLRLEVEDPAAAAALEVAVRQAVEYAARLRVDAVEFVSLGTLEAGRVVIDQRTWD
jgi:phenylacetate-CoA ligase